MIDFSSKRIAHYFTDVLIIGGGLAGLRAALAVSDQWMWWSSQRSVAGEQQQLRPGRHAGVWDEDRFEDHVRINLPRAAIFAIRRWSRWSFVTPTHIRLIQWGTNFDNHDGQLMLGQEGGQPSANPARTGRCDW